MRLCDDKYFKVTNTKTGEVKCYKRAASIARRFKTYKECVFKCIYNENRLLSDKDGCYRVSVNKHPECQQLRWKIKKYFGHNPSYLTEEQITAYKELVEREETNPIDKYIQIKL